MLFKPVLCSTVFAALAAAAPLQTADVAVPDNTYNSTVTPDMSVFAGQFKDQYKFYTGDGSHFKAGWPNMDFWGSWSQMWDVNAAVMRQSCGWNGWGQENSATEIGYIKSAIEQVSGEAGLDKRFILAVVMQESKGCVRVPTTYAPGAGHANPGLMQSHAGSGSCAGVSSCSKAQVVQMIRDGSSGTSAGDGLKQCFAKTKAKIGTGGAQAMYAAARMYNSGSVDYDNLNNGYQSTPCYACDVANRLTGWTLAATNCHL